MYGPGDSDAFISGGAVRVSAAYPGCGRVLAALRKVAIAVAKNDHDLAAGREPHTHERIGYPSAHPCESFSCDSCARRDGKAAGEAARR